ncbi:MAG: UPF0280 family protein [Actinomycetota bacterium]|nr:UPF0280 family protein [Actinomycetota bacterium]MDH5223728.1 UPF0280 family protein [Actinomycetota bacterium]MDH5312634.1 UPF0280 family protein [Actinomycetota bacterium]
MSGPVAATTPDGSRLHLQHGPIDLIIEAWGAPQAVASAYRRAWDRFQPLLDELVAELPALRRPLEAGGALSGPVARRMVVAVEPFGDRFVTPMAAVAGAVADEIRDVMASAGALKRAYVNDGGDIALHLAPGESFDVGLVPIPERQVLLGTSTVRSHDPVRGVATSGRHGRSFSLGIADAVTVFAESAARADAAATLIANEIDLPGHAAIRRVHADELEPDTDMGSRLVTTEVGVLTAGEIAEALDAGVEEAERMRAQGLIAAAVLCLDGQVATVATPVLASAIGG